jgi:hypothetical protein
MKSVNLKNPRPRTRTKPKLVSKNKQKNKKFPLNVKLKILKTKQTKTEIKSKIKIKKIEKDSMTVNNTITRSDDYLKCLTSALKQAIDDNENLLEHINKLKIKREELFIKREERNLAIEELVINYNKCFTNHKQGSGSAVDKLTTKEGGK